MFDFFKKKKVVLKSICNGEVIPVESVEDKMFSNKMLGDGVGFKFANNVIYAPCDGKVIMVANTCHAIGIACENGAEILIHCGLDTVNLNGEGLNVLVHKDEKIHAGQKILEVDVEMMKEKGICLTTPLILTNMESYCIEMIKNNGHVSLNDEICTIVKK